MDTKMNKFHTAPALRELTVQQEEKDLQNSYYSLLWYIKWWRYKIQKFKKKSEVTGFKEILPGHIQKWQM